MATRVVLVDDNPQDRFLVRRALGAEFSDLELTEIRDQVELDRLLSDFNADVVITDYELRWTDGLKVLESVRAIDSDTPVLMFTHTGSEEIAAAGLRGGLSDYIVKSPTQYPRLASAARLAIYTAVARRNESELRAREREALRVAEEALRVKDQFLATLSHELRTPLNAISGWVQIIKSMPDPERLTRGITAIERNTAALGRLIEDLVDVSRMVTGQLALEVTPTDVRQVVEAALDSVRPSALTKGVTIDITAPAALEPISGDPDRLQQIVWNLLSNAVKFTPAGGRVSVTLRTIDASIELSVTDTGPGIRADFLSRVFEPFSQQDPSSTRTQAGLGLGLAIVRHLVDLHRGRVSVASIEGQGATFTIYFPVLDAVLEDEKATLRRVGRRLQGVSVLVVDDDTDSREVLEHILKDHGATVAAAASSAAAYDELRRSPLHVMVCDIAMPEEDGIDFIRRVRTDRDSKIASLPAIAVTAYARDYDRLRTLSAGFQFHLSKPINASELVDTVLLLAKHKAAHRAPDSGRRTRG